MRYFANNALNMHMFVMLPQMRDLTKNLDQIKNIDLTQTFRYDRKATEYAFAQTDKPGTQRPMDDPKKWNDQIIPPRSVLEAINEDINNPFEIITQYFNNIPLINIDHKSLAVEVPFIYQEDIAKYSIYLESWLERNKATLAAWESFAT